ncbi:hypothetical protein TUBRATIS_10340 [Tubulinosema ratisbonensis]|uniref:Uncharacterized protein n=1 Tax=Tubulinosema ratisbonensis TaxID=291195 RepID=A0A437AMS1_9MICR|nr:hypothetical protein TUBRATIS_10340 [Tubulinosema ratisbonensis]
MILFFLNYQQVFNSNTIKFNPNPNNTAVIQNMKFSIMAKKSLTSDSLQNNPLDYSIPRLKKQKMEEDKPQETNKQIPMTSDINPQPNHTNYQLEHHKKDYKTTINLLKNILTKEHYINSDKFLKLIISKIYLTLGSNIRSNLIQMNDKAYNLLINFLNFDINKIISDLNLLSSLENKTNLLIEETYLLFEEYLKNFNQIYKIMVNKHFSYITIFTNIKSYTKQFNLRKSDTICGVKFLYTDFTNILSAIIPELSNENLMFKTSDMQAYLNIKIHSIFSLCVLKLYIDIYKLHSLVNKKIYTDSFKKDILRYRTIFYLLPMNDPFLINYSFECFSLCFFSFYEHINHTTISEEDMKNTIFKFLFPKFLIFSKMIKEKILQQDVKFYIQRYVKSPGVVKDLNGFLKKFDLINEPTPLILNKIVYYHKLYKNQIENNDFYKSVVNEVYKYFYGEDE